MNKDIYLNSLVHCIQTLYCKKVIAYPTESMFGLGCDPDSFEAIKNLLHLKKRSLKNGLILVAANYNQIKSYIDETQISSQKKKNVSLLARTVYIYSSFKFIKSSLVK